MTSTSKIRHKKPYKAAILPEHFHPLDMKDNKVSVNEDRGLLKTLYYTLQIKVFGDKWNPLEDSLKEKFERQIKNLKLGDGRTFFKISELKEKE